MTTRWSRLLPLTAIAFAVLGLGGLFAGPNTPNSAASGATVIAFYTSHRSGQQATDMMLFLAFVILVFFAGSLRSFLRETPRCEGPSAVLLAGAAITAVGFMIFTGVDWALADLPTKLTPAAAQVLNLIDNDLTFPLRGGMCIWHGQSPSASSSTAVSETTEPPATWTSKPAWLTPRATGRAALLAITSESPDSNRMPTWPGCLGPDPNESSISEADSQPK